MFGQFVANYHRTDTGISLKYYMEGKYKYYLVILELLLEHGKISQLRAQSSISGRTLKESLHLCFVERKRRFYKT